MEAGRIRFMLGAIYDVFPSPQNLGRWIGEDPICPLCSGNTLARALGDIIRFLADAIERKG